MAMGGAAAYSLLILYCFYHGLFRGALSDISIILAVGWTGYIAIFVLILTGSKPAIQR